MLDVLGQMLSDIHRRVACVSVDLVHSVVLRAAGVPDVEARPRHPQHEAEDDRPQVQLQRALGGRRRRRGGAGGARGDRRVPARPAALPEARRPRAQGRAAVRAAGHRQDAAGQGRGPRVGRELLLPERVVVRRDVRRAGRRPHPQAVRDGAQEPAGDRLHRRARRRRHVPHRRRPEPRARPDAEPAAGRAGRLRGEPAADRDGGVQPARGSRYRAAPARPFRPPDPRLAARPVRAARRSSASTRGASRWRRTCSCRRSRARRRG